MKIVLIKILTIFLLSFLLLPSVFASSTGSIQPSGQRQPSSKTESRGQQSSQLSSQLASELPFVESGVLIPLGSSIYDKMDALFIMAGKGVPSTSRPWTVAQARHELLLINPNQLFPKESSQEKATQGALQEKAAQGTLQEKATQGTLQEETSYEKLTQNPSQKLLQLYNELYTYLFTEDKNTLSLTATISPEAYLHTNTEYNRAEYWLYGYEKRNHIASLKLDNSTHGIYGHLELSLGKGMVAGEDATSAVTIKEYVESLGKTWAGVGTLIDKDEGDKFKVIAIQKNYTERFSFNLPSLNNADMNVPRRAYLLWSNNFMTLGIYKAQKSWGYNKGGNFIFDSHNDYYSWLGLKTYSKNFNFEYSLVFPETYRGGTNYYSEDSEKYRRVFATHQIEFRLFDKANIALSENVMYRFNGYYDINQLNPATIYHNNVNNHQFNALAHVEFEISILPSLLLYGSWVCDQGSFPGFEDKSTEDQAMGYSIGLEYDIFICKGIARFSIEGIYTNPALYRPTPSSDFIINYNAINADDYFRYPFFTYIGYKYGGDTISLRADANYRKENWYLYSSLELRFDGEFTLYDEYKSPMLLTAPSGDYDTVLTFNVGGEYRTTLWSALPLKFFADVTLTNSAKRGFDAQFALGGAISYAISTN